jgi:hypothetical protein
MAKKARGQRRLPFRIVAFVFAIVFLLAGARESIAGYVCLKHGDHGAPVGEAGTHSGHAGHHAGSGPAAAEASRPATPGVAEHGGHAPADHAGHTSAEHADHLAGQASGPQVADAGDSAEAALAGHTTGHEGEPCSCLGDCQPTQTIATEEDTPDAYVLYTFPAPARVSHVAAWLPGTPRFLLPPANGPPLIG